MHAHARCQWPFALVTYCDACSLFPAYCKQESCSTPYVLEAEFENGSNRGQRKRGA